MLRFRRAAYFRNAEHLNTAPPITRHDFEKADVGNTLQAAACRVYKEVEQLIELLREHNTVPRMSGSGGAVFIDGEDDRINKSVVAELPDTCRARICTGVAFTRVNNSSNVMSLRLNLHLSTDGW